ncbi:variable surface protein [Plasmodium gonderi]|uniref:Variable surface protein n=1 Tax=Plasmodium gonderi TaxID=77519 RepID=A0A1Y1JHK3_PLAGO|nr:variable surface protein [Plasmodium gonderi]GAW82009.1 variable surface protein [Plasmodium gonderi]
MKTNASIDETEFNEIFPNFDNEYDYALINYSNKNGYGMLGFHLSTFCYGFINREHNDIEKKLKPFYNSCMELGRYLYHIENEKLSEVEKILNCIYFSYKLKMELGKYSSNDKNLVALFKRTVKPSIINDEHRDVETFIQVCHEFDEYSGDDGSEILENFKKVYNIIEELKDNTNYCTSCKQNYEEYMSSLESSKCKDISSFKFILEKIKNFYECKCPLEKNVHLDHYPTVEQISENTENNSMNDTNNIAETNPKISPNEGTNTLLINEPFTNELTETITSVNIGTFSVISVILILIFILYKYTPYGSYLLRRILMSGRRLNRRYKDHLNLMESFDKTYNNSIDDRYSIAYKSEYYS